MAAFLVQQPDGEGDPSDQPTEPVPVGQQTQPWKITDLPGGDCVLCLLSYESRFGRPVNGEDYDSSRLSICQHHIRLLMMAHDEELDLFRETVEMAYLRYLGPSRFY